MKKKIAFLICLIMILGNTAFAENINLKPTDKITIFLNNEKVDKFEAKVIDGQILIPVDLVKQISNSNYELDTVKKTLKIKTLNNEKKVEKQKIETAEMKTEKDLENYLNENYSKLDTAIGSTEFKFEVNKNTFTGTPYDYWIQTDFDLKLPLSMSSIEYTREQKNQLVKELKDHQETIAKDVLKLFPDKKIRGGYYKSWYRYPTLRVDLVSRQYFTWNNYSKPDYLSHEIYESSKITSFHWDSSIDDKFN